MNKPTATILVPGTQVAVEGRPYLTFTVGSLRTYAKKHGEDEATAIEQERSKAKRNFFQFQMAWLNTDLSVLDGTVKAVPSTVLKSGELVQIEGEPESYRVTFDGCARDQVRIAQVVTFSNHCEVCGAQVEDACSNHPDAIVQTIRVGSPA